MRWRTPVVTSISLIILTACAGSTSNPPAGATHAPADTTLYSSGVRGQLNYVGGPTGGRYLMEPGTVNAVGVDGGHGGVARFPQGGGFSIPLAPGTYRLVGKSGDAICRSQTVKVVAGGFATVTIVCDVK